jgi:hypothetical protein
MKVAFARPFRVGGRRRAAVLVAGLLAILAWQAPNLQWPDRIDTRYQALASKGLDYEYQFVYLLYYLGLYPVASRTEWPPREYSEEGARQLLERAPQSLVQDKRFTFYSGEMGKGLLYLFDAWLKGEPRDPTVRPFHRLVWLLSLCGLWTSFWWVRRPIVGGLLVAFFGSNPLALQAVVAEENIHGWPVLGAAIVLALAVPFLTTAPPGRVLRWVLPIATGVVLGSIRTVRTEPTLMVLAPIVAYVVARALRPWTRLALVAALVASFGLTYRAWQAWFDAKDREAKALLTRIGGHPYPGTHFDGHQVWHPIWCGLGDFDTKYGYAWSDDAAYAYAQPILLKRYGIRIPIDQFGPEGRFLDAAKVYRRFGSSLPEYVAVIRAKVLSDITNDPLWYLDILARRAWRLLDEPSPVRVDVAFRHVPIPLHGLVLFPLAAMLWSARSRFALKLLLFTLPTCITPLVIYSGQGMSYYALYPIPAAAILGAVAVDALRRWWRTRAAPAALVDRPASRG